ncbi:NhaC family Na+:H+ antiporter [Peribacillus deserti]|uniref:NhaC family Na+:H+ antiporter n=1 Tax=Peribacillus deserti TaxID=673318 RepID=A0ABS2QNL4_9BACI|nr:Na+/H+ antiporter NhaC family protein [Peribacillus deserti]MBM7694525.1 NhaC family Na+:H+ antiporter [Peribacillus deserti]
MTTFKAKEVIFLFVITLTGVLYSVIAHIPLVIGFLPGFLVLLVLCRQKKVPIKKLLDISFRGAAKTRIVVLILFFVSFLLPSWHLSGTLDQMVAVTLRLLDPNHFFILSFLAAALFSMTLGTSVGTLSAIGVPIMSTAVLLGLPMEITAGALISGAFVGDRTSPFSSAHQLMAHTIEISVKSQQKAMITTTLPAILICCLFYAIIDHFIDIQGKTLFVNSNGSILFIQFIPPLFLVVMVLMRVKILYGFIASIASAGLIAIYKSLSFSQLLYGFWYGIEGTGGGLAHMYSLLLFIIVAGAYNGLLEELNMIQPYLDKWLKTSKSLKDDSIKIILSTLFISFIAANQTLPIILTGRSFLSHWSKYYKREDLARVMGDTTLIFPGMVPWSILAIMCSTILNVSLFSYLPYAVFLWILPCLTILFSILRNGNLKINDRPLESDGKL